MPTSTQLETCDCCSGTSVQTPAKIANAPGLRSVAYRIGWHASFKASLLARLSGSDVPALAGLGARGDDDPTIALLDGFAVMADVLTFYQERIANEAYLRTATERRSVLELARLLGYQLSPGVAADAWLAFTLEEPRPGTAATLPVTIPERTKVQSVPGPDELPQTFETVVPIEARVERNSIAVQTAEAQPIIIGQQELTLAGTDHQLAPGDVILIVGRERIDRPQGEQWDVRLLRTVEPDLDRGITRITWVEGLGTLEGRRVEPAHRQVRVFVFRQRAALFGHNAPDPLLMPKSVLDSSLVKNGNWANYQLSGTEIDLDQSYPKIVPGSWIALVSEKIKHRPSSLSGYTELYRAVTVGHRSLSMFGVSSRVTHIGLDTGEHLAWYTRRDTLALAQSEELPLAPRPIRSPVYGDTITLATIVPGLAPGQVLAVSGVRQHVRVTRIAGRLQFTLADASVVDLVPGDRLVLVAARTGDAAARLLDPDELTLAIETDDPQSLSWTLEDRDGNTGTLVAGGNLLDLDPATKGDPSYAEIVRLIDRADAVVDDRDRTSVRLAAALRRAYDRRTVRINANVAPATHGETVSEILGSGDAVRRDQRMALKQGPLTYVGADTPSGRRSTAEVRVNDILWDERPTLYQAGPRDHVHLVRSADAQTATVIFGDGAEGARLPTGAANVRARYRKGLGAAGNVRAGQLSTLLTRPLGVAAVANPEPAAGGEDPEPLDAARLSAPMTVLTLDRAVSRQDYQDFARSFAGVAKAHAAWIALGPARSVLVTVAGPEGAAIAEGSTTHARLTAALRAFGDPLLPLAVRRYVPVTFELSVDVKIDDAFEPSHVVVAVRAELVTAFAFAARAFGQPVSVDEVVSVIHRVPGVIAVDVNVLRRQDHPRLPAVEPRLRAAEPRVSDGAVIAAELLTLDPHELVVGVMA